MRKNNKLIVIISIVVVLAIASAVFVYLFMATDMFKSDKELFVKYISQNLETFQKMTNSQTIQTYQQLKDENKYDSNTNIKISHSEGGEVSNPLNNLSVKLDIQKDNEEQYMYLDGQILFANEEYLEAEIIKLQELYGIRFSDVAKQFVTVKQDENFEKVANNIGINSEDLEKIINVIDGTTQLSETIIQKDEITTLKEKYFNFIKQSILQGEFNSLKDAMITYNNETVKTNAYTVTISNKQIENFVIEVLNNLKTETIIIEKIQNFIDEKEFVNQIDKIIAIISEEQEMPSVKITVYERKEQNIRTVVEIGTNKIILENIADNSEMKTKIQLSSANEEHVIENNIELRKKYIQNQETYSLNIERIEDEQSYIIDFINDMKLEDNNIILKTTINRKENITTQEMIIENTIKIGEDFEKLQILDESNNVVLNNIEEEKQIIIINLLKENVPVKVQTRLELLQKALGLKNDEIDNEETETEDVTEEEMSQTDINKFNSKFEFYTGDAVSFENVKTLLGIVKDNISNYEIVPIVNENEENNEDDEKYNIKIYIEKDKIDEEGINKILEKIEEGKKYKVLIVYKEGNALIDYITINEVEN